MGLAATQARLLTITARIHDVEYEVMRIMNEKVELGTHQDKIYQDYCRALDAQKLQIAVSSDSTSLNYVDATFTNICGYNNSRKGTFALIDSSTGRMIVEDDAYDAYKEYSNDKYAFAWAMMGFEKNDFAWADTAYEGTGDQVGINSPSGEPIKTKDGSIIYVRSMTEAEEYVFDKHKDLNLDETVKTKYDKYQTALQTGDRDKISAALSDFRSAFTSKYFEEIYDAMRLDKEGVTKEQAISSGQYIPGFDGDYDPELKDEFDYYVRVFEGIEHAGGCIPVSKYSEDGDTGNEWLNNLMDYGMITINEYDKKKGWSATSVSGSSNLKQVTDNNAIKRAEAKYQYELSIINKKEAKMDQDLKSLEAERSALNTEFDSYKNIIDENIKRTYKIG